MSTQRKETLSLLDKGPVFLRWWSRAPLLLAKELLCTRGKRGCHCCPAIITRHHQLLQPQGNFLKMQPFCSFTRNFLTPGVIFKKFVVNDGERAVLCDKGYNCPRGPALLGDFQWNKSKNCREQIVEDTAWMVRQSLSLYNVLHSRDSFCSVVTLALLTSGVASSSLLLFSFSTLVLQTVASCSHLTLTP